MIRHLDFGQAGEDLAAAWLAGQGHHILERNWKHAHGEIDIITRKNDVYHFVEIKSGRTNKFGYPESRVSKVKMSKIMRVASAWLYKSGINGSARIQFDALSISVSPAEGVTFTLFSDIHPR